MINLSKVKYFLFYYRYNIIVPSIVGGLVLYDYLNLKEKRRIKLARAERKAKEALKNLN